MTASMVPKYLYRLKDYRICRLANGRLWWEAHSEFGSQASGSCYIWGDILLLGARHNEEIGFLKSEFLDSLRKLPDWRKTRYYCFASALLDLHTGQAVNENQLRQKIPPHGTSVKDAGAIFPRESELFRLGRYQVMVNADGRITWTCPGSAGRMIVGQAVIESGILFLGPGRIGNEKKNRKDYLSTLRKLPEWDLTIFWCRSLALKAVSKEDKPGVPPSRREKETYRQKGTASAGSRQWDPSKWLWSRMVCCYNSCLDHGWKRRLQKKAAELIRKGRDRIAPDR